MSHKKAVVEEAEETEGKVHPLSEANMFTLRLQGKRMTIWCVNFIYTGTLAEIHADCVKLDDPSVVYETGGLTEGTWKDAQELPDSIYVMRAAIECFGIMK